MQIANSNWDRGNTFINGFLHSSTQDDRVLLSFETEGRNWPKQSESNHVLFDVICSMRYFDRAGLFVEACQEYGFLSPKEEKNSILISRIKCL